MSKLNPRMQEALDELIKCISESDEYCEYKSIKESIGIKPEDFELVKRSQEIRKKLHDIPEYEYEGEYAQRLFSEYQDLIENTSVYNYSHAEVQMGEMLRELLTEIIDAVGLE